MVDGSNRGTVEINEFQMFQKFRLHMVKNFGSVASALFEFGAARESGELTRQAFVSTCTERLKLFTIEEAHLLFTHVTNADPTEWILNGNGGVATLRHFNIQQTDWEKVVEQKLQAAQGKQFAPFASGPSGSSMGIYHRQMTVDEVSNRQNSASQGPKTARSTSDSFKDGSISEGKNEGESHPSHGASGKLSTPRKRQMAATPRSRAWQQPQIPWTKSMYAGDPGNGKGGGHRLLEHGGRANEFSFVNRTKVSLIAQPKYAQLGTPERHRSVIDEMSGRPMQHCPPCRKEMEPDVVARQVDAWWPHSSTAPPRRLNMRKLHVRGFK